MLTHDPITSPDDIATRPDLAFQAERADRDNDAAAIGYAPRYVHRPITRAQLDAAIYGAIVDCGKQLDQAVA